MNEHQDIDPENPDAQPQALRRRYPAIVGNALICSDGTTHQLRVLEKLYVRCGIVSVHSLDHQYRQGLPRQLGRGKRPQGS